MVTSEHENNKHSRGHTSVIRRSLLMAQDSVSYFIIFNCSLDKARDAGWDVICDTVKDGYLETYR